MSIAENLERLKARISEAALRAGRDPQAVRLVGVTKTVDPQRIEAAVQAGLQDLGENYVQEAREKIAKLPPGLRWHFIGRLQTNKAKYAVKLFHLIHTVDSRKLAKELNRRAEAAGRLVPILVQVNIAAETSKGGIRKEDVLPIIEYISTLPFLRLKGLMTMPPFFDQPEKVRPYFRQLRQLSRQIAARRLANVDMTELSMGMSGDFEVAIEEGATLVRVGTALFGRRT
ncbi:MAG: YggS family pyridoxal phosphate-dependent enzyme [Deltaproteobacteria bacterium]|nr:YggS family pyridoxal phosphate-dependent enzyme [Deltaproteobacteria bacterium]MBW2072343.1 YggS family pyridoxal phosphate-dependent enzyme [Deltaproteobacteria bacterium]